MPEATILTALLFGFLLGIKHALDADHIVAVTAIVSRSRSLRRAALVGLSWGTGHTITLFAAGFAVIVLKLTIPDRLALSMEFLVGVLLVLLGVPIIRQVITRKAHVHWHQHEEKSHFHSHSHQNTPAHSHQHLRRPLLIGMVHGLAGSGALTLLVLSTMSSVAQGLVFLLVFGIGSMLGMLLFSGLIGLPFKLTAGFSRQMHTWVQGAAGIISVTLGAYIMWYTGFISGLFLFPG